MTEGELPRVTKELLAMVISITRECDGCIVAHTRGALREGASRQQVAEAIGVAIAMNGGPGTVWVRGPFTPTTKRWPRGRRNGGSASL